ncbi:hypothetical protein [Acaryochloris marina]|uniref:Uncharacterized protein n=1 Tax=Acaryochloris marina (strain MBIC 11017) TaxID=329726 RepID=A8ZPM9_ACAM1|nr:hypothetical protein [Acaryochloris marina]ABW32965.1 hypothetical protein AM1_E0196 [Acaryochloris marina MBIC11017]
MIGKILSAVVLMFVLSSPVAIAQVQSNDQVEEVIATASSALSPSAVINKVAIVGNFALVSWTDGHAGSSATLRNSDQGWVVVTDSMRGWPPVDVYARENGMTVEEAEALFDAFNPKWRQWQR